MTKLKLTTFDFAIFEVRLREAINLSNLYLINRFGARR